MRRRLHHGQFLFAAGFLAYLLVLLRLSFDLIRPARLFPLIILTPLTGLVTLQLLVVVSPTVARRLSALMKPVEIASEEDEWDVGPSPAAEVVKAIGWIVAFGTAMYLVGFYWATALLTFGFALADGRGGLRMAVLSSVGLTGVLYLIFTRAVYVELYKGVLWELFR